METTIQDITGQFTGRIIAVSDVHGHGHYLKGLLEKITFTKEDALVIIGDLIEKGGNSLATVRDCIKMQKEGYHIYMSAGNVDFSRLSNFFDRSAGHGGRFVEELRQAKEVWRCGLFLEILKEMGIPLSQVCPENAGEVKGKIAAAYKEELGFFAGRPTIITCGDYIFVHAGIPTDRLEELKNEDGFRFLKTDAFLEQKHVFGRPVVVGHWPVCLYGTGVDCMDPVFDYERHAVAIDGGCALKRGAQLNALLIPHPHAGLLEVGTQTYDDYPIVYAKTAQEAVPATVCIRFWDAEVELLSGKEEAALAKKQEASQKHSPESFPAQRHARLQEVVTLRHKSSGQVFEAPKNYLYRRGERLLCSDFANAGLGVQEGEALKLVTETSAGAIVKKGGTMGWYFGELLH